MTRLVAIAVLITVVLAPRALGQAEADAPRPLAGVIAHGEGEVDAADAARIRRAFGGLDAFESLDDAASIAALARAMLAVAGTPGASMALLEAGPDALVVAARMPGSVVLSASGRVQVWGIRGDTYVVYDRATSAGPPADAIAALADAFDAHREADAPTGVELMLDLENLRRAWPDAFGPGTARSVLRATGLANARKIHLTLPDDGAVRLAYSSRAEPADRVAVVEGPAGLGEADGFGFGSNWPRIANAVLALYAAALPAESRGAAGQRIRSWMEANGGRLRAILGAADAGGAWSLKAGRPALAVPVRDAVGEARLREVAGPLFPALGMAEIENGGSMPLPAHFAAALGGSTLTATIETREGGLFYVLAIE
ncbi:MAG: hypothetical protein AAFX79_07690 [Planctomycetota bacterium]